MSTDSLGGRAKWDLQAGEAREYPLLNDSVSIQARVRYCEEAQFRCNVSEDAVPAPGTCVFCRSLTSTVVLHRTDVLTTCRFFAHAECWAMARVIEVMTL